MLEKLFVRVRSWFHIDPSTAAATPSGSAPAGLSGPGGNGMGAGGFSRNAGAPKEARRTSTPPPPMPGEAFGDSSELTMEAQPESGMVITESGIIIIDPNLDPDAAKLATTPISSGAQAVASDTWALPNLARPTPAEARNADASDWDAVLSRARSQLATPPPAPGPTRRK